MASVLIVVAIGVLVVVRVSGDDGDDAPDAGPPGSSTTIAASIPAGPETFLDDEPSTVTPADLAGLHFTDVTEAAGLAHPQSDRDLRADMSMTSGAAVADIDADGDPDLYVTRVGLPNSLYRNDGDGAFTDIAAASGVDRAVADGGYQGSGAAAFADIDADGCVDLYVAGAGDGTHPGEAALFVNDCSGRFTDDTSARGVALPPTEANLGAQGHGVTFADYDRDGHLDLLVLQWDPAFLGGRAGQEAFEQHSDPDSLCERTAATRAAGADRAAAAGPNRSRLFRNDGTGHFTDVTAAVGLPLDQIAAFTGEFADVDDDGWADLLITGDFCTSAIFHNDGGTAFTDITVAAGVGTDENGMGSVVADVNDDGRPDWFVTSIAGTTKSGQCPTRSGNTGCSGNRLYLNEGDGTFSDATDEYGVRNGWWGWGAAVESFDNDDHLVIAQADGYAGDDPPRDAFASDPLRLWVPADMVGASDAPADPARTREAADAAGFASDAVAHALVPFDYDADGDLDVFVANFGGPPNLFRNDTPADRHWVTVRLDDPSHPGNRSAIGAEVTVTWADDSSRTGWIGTSGSYESQRLPQLHVGLGGHTGPVQVEVRWPGDAEPQRFADQSIDRVLTVTRG